MSLSNALTTVSGSRSLKLQPEGKTGNRTSKTKQAVQAAISQDRQLPRSKWNRLDITKHRGMTQMETPVRVAAVHLPAWEVWQNDHTLIGRPSGGLEPLSHAASSGATEVEYWDLVSTKQASKPSCQRINKKKTNRGKEIEVVWCSVDVQP